MDGFWDTFNRNIDNLAQNGYSFLGTRFLDPGFDDGKGSLKLTLTVYDPEDQIPIHTGYRS